VAAKRRKSKKKSGNGAFIGRALSGIWRAVAKAIGSSVRFLARGARDLDPVHQRDGVAFLFLIFALIAAAGSWFHLNNLIGRALYDFFYGGFGRIGFFTPVLLLYFALRLFRVPDEKAATGRITVGTIALMLTW
jgi:S-DNA-T family DNA segregation ATPase FtsK/SpoIIIE